MTTKNPNFSENMLSVEEARENILNMMFVLNTEYLPISDCLGHVLSEDISSIIHVPPWNNSAMDGFAVIANDTKNASEIKSFTKNGLEVYCHDGVIKIVSVQFPGKKLINAVDFFNSKRAIILPGENLS